MGLMGPGLDVGGVGRLGNWLALSCSVLSLAVFPIFLARVLGFGRVSCGFTSGTEASSTEGSSGRGPREW